VAERVRYVDTASTAGGDGTVDTTTGANRAYPSLNAAEAGEQDNFDTDNDWLHVLSRSSVGGNDTAAVAVSGSITSPADFMLFEGNGEFYRLATVNATSISIPDEYVRFESMDISVSETGSTSRFCAELTPSAGGADIRFERCKIHEVSGGGTGITVGIFTTDSDTILRVSNCWFYDWRQGDSRACRMQGGSSWWFHNVFFNCDTGLYDAGGTVEAINNIAKGCTDGFLGTFDGDTDYNISDIASDAPGANSFQGSVTFVSEVTPDFHLDAGDTVAVGAGIDVSADPNYPISEDIDGLAYASWDGVNIGSDQFEAGGGGQTISPGGHAARGAYSAATVSPGAVTIAPDSLIARLIYSAFDVAQAVGQTIEPASAVARGAYGSFTLAPGAVSISFNGHVARVAAGSFTVSPGQVTLTLNGLVARGIHGSVDVVLVITPGSAVARVTFGGITVAPGQVTLTPDGLIVRTAYGNFIVTREGDAAEVLYSRVVVSTSPTIT
jgi:hypothetical protein